MRYLKPNCKAYHSNLYFSKFFITAVSLRDPYDYQVVEMFLKQAEQMLNGPNELKEKCESLVHEKL